MYTCLFCDDHERHAEHRFSVSNPTSARWITALGTTAHLLKKRNSLTSQSESARYQYTGIYYILLRALHDIVHTTPTHKRRSPKLVGDSGISRQRIPYS